jgi:hypothetical protein
MSEFGSVAAVVKHIRGIATSYFQLMQDGINAGSKDEAIHWYLELSGFQKAMHDIDSNIGLGVDRTVRNARTVELRNLLNEATNLMKNKKWL